MRSIKKLSVTAKFLSGAILAAVTLLWVGLEARAGFEWVPPARQPAAQAQSAEQQAPAAALPVAPVTSEIMTPAPASIPAQPAEPAQAAAPVPAPIQAIEAPPAPAPQPVPAQAVTPANGQPQHLLKVKTVSAPEALSPAPPQTEPPAQQISAQQPVPPPQILRLPAPQAVKRPVPEPQTAETLAPPVEPVKTIPQKLIMPADAPRHAIAIGNTQTIAQPAQEPAPAPVEMPAPETDIEVTATLPSEESSKEPLALLPPEDMQNESAAMEKTTEETSAPKRRSLFINPFPRMMADSSEKPAPAATEPASGDMRKNYSFPFKLTPSSPSSSYEVVQGFGSDLPLVMALQQVVPSTYAYSFDSGVNPGTPVSWEGGKPWDAVVSDMVAPLGLQALVKGKIVQIGQVNARRIPAENHSALEQDADRLVRRASIRDPGETRGIQPLSLQAHKVEPASGGEEASTGPRRQKPTPFSIFGIFSRDKDSEESKNAMPEKISQDAAPTSPAPAPALAADNAGEEISWQARRGDSLKELLAGWSQRANMDLDWEAEHDYTVNADISVNGDFREALSTLLSSGLPPGESQPHIRIRSTENPSKNGSLFVESKKG
ncbi:MAG: TcpQ domain-containing protein [Alphaproteobacteria bacterium]|nr:TcpQ domain-containing protein [Alphaproteobacteria bacterium]